MRNSAEDWRAWARHWVPSAADRLGPSLQTKERSALVGEELKAELKSFRLLLIHIAGRMNSNSCVKGLRLENNMAVLHAMQTLRQMFELPTQATATTSLGRRGGELRAKRFRKPAL